MALSGRERTIGIVAGIVLGALAFDWVLLSPMLARLTEADDRVSAARAKLAEADTAQSNLLVARRTWSRVAGASLQTETSQAEGQLLNKVTDYAQQVGLSPGSLRPERAEREQDFQRITVRATLTGTMEQFSQFLFSLKNADIPLRVNDMQISALREGSNELSMQIGVSTIFNPPRPDATGNAATNPPSGGRQ